MQGTHNYHQSNGGGGGVRGLASPERGERKGNSGAYQNHENMVINRTASSPEKGGSSSGGGGDVVVWPPKFMIALTNKEKEEDFMAIKGSKLPQRPKKRAKFIQRTLNVSLLSLLPFSLFISYLFTRLNSSLLCYKIVLGSSKLFMSAPLDL